MAPGASEVTENEGPAGEYLVTLRDPDAVPVDLVWGLAAKPKAEDDIAPVNFPSDKPRKGQFRRSECMLSCPITSADQVGTDSSKVLALYSKSYILDCQSVPQYFTHCTLTHVFIID